MPSEKQSQPHNPYASAAGAYGTSAQKTTSDPREVEARVLLKAAQFMLDLQNDWDNVTPDLLEETLKYNRSIWLMFYDTAVENTEGEQRPDALRNNIYNLANFIFQREIDILAKPEKKKFDVLIKINRDIAGGLMTGVRNSQASSGETANAAAPAPAENADEKKPPSGGWDSSA